MSRLPFSLQPFADLARSGARWVAQSDAPWFELTSPQPLAGNWIRLSWSAGLLEPVCRPVLRCLTAGGQHDEILPGAPFGRNRWIGRIPEGTRQILLSPVGQAREFGFRLDRLERIAPTNVARYAARNALDTVLHSAGARLIGRDQDSRSLLRDALALKHLENYSRWRAKGLRDLEPDAFDGRPHAEAGRIEIRILVPAGEAASGDAAALARELATQPHQNWSLVVSGIATPEVSDRRVSFMAPDAGPDRILADLKGSDLVVVAGAGTRFEPLALLQIAHHAASQPETAIFFGDEDRLTPRGLHRDPVFRPAFDPLLLEKADCLGSTPFIRRSAISELASVDPVTFRAMVCRAGRSGYPASSLGRVISGSPFGDPLVLATEHPATARPPRKRQAAPEATIIVPTRDRLDLLRPCIDSIIAGTESAFRILIADNGSAKAETLAYLAGLQKDTRIDVLPMPGPFNFSDLCNRAAARATTGLLVFLNNDTAIITPDWLAHLGHFAMQPHVGAVGAKLLFADGRVQHGGVIAGLGGRAGHFQPGLSRSDAGYFGRGNVPHHLSAVTGACLAVERRKFEAVGGFDAVNLPVDLNDIDLCFRLAEKGFQTVMAPDCLLYHYESATRGKTRKGASLYASERRYFSARWLHVLRADPHFSASLSLYTGNPKLG